MSETILTGTIHVLTDKDNQIYTPIYPKSRKDLIDGLENVDNTSDSSKRVAFATNASNAENATNAVNATNATNASNDGLGNNINNTYVKNDIIKIKYRKTATAYNIGDIIYLPTLKLEKKLVCIKTGTTSSGNITVSNTTEGVLVNDGSVVWIIDSLADGIYDAAHQNGIYRGADLTAYWDSGYMSTNIRAGKFVGMHIGDYVSKTINLPAITYTDKSGNAHSQSALAFGNAAWELAAFNPHLMSGDSSSNTTTHHVLLISSNTRQTTVSMNPTNSTEGGYLGSDMWRVHIPNWANAIKTAFGAAHVLRHREYLSNAINATAPSSADNNYLGTATGYEWVDVDVNIPNESMICGSRVVGSNRDNGDFPIQLPLFSFNMMVGGTRRLWFWLRSVASAKSFSFADGYGFTSFGGAMMNDARGGIRPYFLAY